MDGRAEVAKAIYAELDGILARPERAHTPKPLINDGDDLRRLSSMKLFGLAFSGGGIRSATFNLGVLQALQDLGLLKYVDYLSTVSGGGYIGSWYLACLRQGRTTNDTREKPVEHLRKFSQYLAPEAGFFSFDTWTIISIWLRNTMMLQTMLGSLFAIALLSPRFFEIGFLKIPVPYIAAAAILFFSVAVACIASNLAELNTGNEASTDGQDKVQYFAAWPGMASAACFASLLCRLQTHRTEFLWYASAIVGLATWLTAWFSLPSLRRKSWKGNLIAPGIGLLSGASFYGLTWTLGWLFVAWWRHPYGIWLSAIAGAPAVLIILGVAVVLQVGLLGRDIQDSSREWWARLGAFIVIYSLGPLAVGIIGVFGPRLVELMQSGPFLKWVGGTFTVGGILTTVGGLFAAKSPETGGGSNAKKELLAAIAPYVFIVGLMMLVATGLHAILAAAPVCEGMSYWDAMSCSINVGRSWLCATLGISLAVLFLLGWRVDINEASMNPFYRNRLTRCYQGAARTSLRRPNLLTGFDSDDDFYLSTLKPGVMVDVGNEQIPYDGPVPIINTALNLTGGQDAGLQERRASSFFFTPYKSGSTITGVMDTTNTSRTAKGIFAGACVATSGAAASPNMGYHTSAPIAFLLTFFNVRLGLWTSNPLTAREPRSIRWGVYYLLKELFALASSEDHLIYLSDGGHFENLGVYELVRRHCRYIIVGDAEEDGGMTFESLGGVIRKCRIDFGIEIDIDTSEIRNRDANGRSRVHCAVGRIYYPGIDPKDAGYLIYLKSSLTGDEETDVLQYKSAHPNFPHESTGDQFFSESQFESYRYLGWHVAREAFRPAAVRQEVWQKVTSRADLENWMVVLKRGWTPASPFTPGNFTRHTEALMEIWDDARQDPDLSLADPVLFPGWTEPAPLATDGEVRRRKALYTCQRILQLMENAYLDLRLEETFNHPDNVGWNAIFKTWANSPLFQETYIRSRKAYGIRFRAFCERELGLPGDPN